MMNKRTIILLSICFMLAVVSLTIRYIEQEKESIKARFVGEKPTEERSAGSVSYSRDLLPVVPPVEVVPSPMKQEANLTPLSDSMTPPSAGTIAPATQSSQNSAAITGRKQLNTAIAGIQEKSVERETNASLDQPLSTTLEEVSTPLGPKEEGEVPSSVSETEGGGGFDAQEVKAKGAEGKNVPAAETGSAVDDGKPVAAEEQTDQVTAEGGAGENDEVQKDAVIEGTNDDQEDEVIGEGEPSEDEEMVEEDQLPEESEAQQEEGEEQGEEEVEAAAAEGKEEIPEGE